MNNKYTWNGKFDIKVINKKTGEIKEETKVNRVMNEVLNQLRDVLKGESADLEIKYLALGTSNTAITDTDTQLGAEIFRTQFIAREDISTGRVRHTFIVLDSEAVGQIEEIGIFGGSTATASANTGTLISRVLWNKEKTNQEEIQFIRTDTIGRG